MRDLRAIALAALASCGMFPDLSELTSDGGGDATLDAPSVETGGDAGVADVVDAGPDRACAAQHLFCDDFDDDAAAFSKWDKTNGIASFLVLSTTNAVTPPNALSATVRIDAGSNESDVQKLFPAANHTHIELDVTVANTGNDVTSEVDLVTLEMATPPSPYTYANLNLQRNKTAARLEEYLENGSTPASQDIPISETFASKRHVALDLDFTTQKWEVAFDGVPITSITLNPPLTKSAFSLSVGVTYVSSSAQGDWTAWVDNVTLDQQ